MIVSSAVSALSRKTSSEVDNKKHCSHSCTVCMLKHIKKRAQFNQQTVNLTCGTREMPSYFLHAMKVLGVEVCAYDSAHYALVIRISSTESTIL